MTIKKGCFLILSLFAASATTAAQIKDYSQKGPEYSVLRDIRLDVVSIVPKGVQDILVEGREMNATVFSLVTKEAVPFLEGNSPYNNVMKDLEVHYEVMVAADRDNYVHNRLIEVLADVSKRPIKERDFSNVGLSGGRGKYLLFSGPSSMPNYVWFDGRVIIVRFIGIKERRRDRVFNTQTFWQNKIRFYAGDEKVPITSIPKSFGEGFLNRLRSGEFQRPK
jgi:hypothetical protein